MALKASKSKMVEALRKVSRGAPTPIGFSRAAPPTGPAVLLIACLPKVDAELAVAAEEAGADAIIIRIGAGPYHHHHDPDDDDAKDSDNAKSSGNGSANASGDKSEANDSRSD